MQAPRAMAIMSLSLIPAQVLPRNQVVTQTHNVRSAHKQARTQIGNGLPSHDGFSAAIFAEVRLRTPKGAGSLKARGSCA